MANALAIPYTSRMTIMGATDRPVHFPSVEKDPDFQVTQIELPLKGQRRLFLQTPSENILRTEHRIVLKIDHVRDDNGGFLSLEGLAAHFELHPNDFDRIQGNGVVIHIDLSQPSIVAFRTLLSAVSLFHWADGTDFVLADNLRHVSDVAGNPQIEETVLPHHYLFRCTWDHLTYIKNIQQLDAGEVLKWEDHRVTVRRVSRMLRGRGEGQFLRLNDETLGIVDDTVRRNVGQCLEFAEAKDRAVATMLSGGTDSSYLQVVVDRHLSSKTRSRSYSYQVDVPEFEPEVEYALNASEALGTEHTLITVTADEFAESLVEMIKILGQTPVTEDDPSLLAMARSLHANQPDLGFLFEGSGADSLLGSSHAPIWWQMDRLRSLTKFGLGLRVIELLMRRVNPASAFILREVMELAPFSNDPTSRYFPGIDAEMYSDYDQVLRCFGQRSITESILSFQESERENLSSDTIVERAHMMGYFALVLPDMNIRNSLFRLHDIDLFQPYMDPRFVETVLSIDPRERFYFQGTIKPISKRLLSRKVGIDVHKPKLGGGIFQELVGWMKEGVLRDMVMSIDRPGYINKTDFESKLARPDWFTWNMLTLDLLKKHGLPRKGNQPASA